MGAFQQLEKKHRVELKDLWLATEVTLHNLEILQKEIKLIWSGEMEKESIRLERSMDVDCTTSARH